MTHRHSPRRFFVVPVLVFTGLALMLVVFVQRKAANAQGHRGQVVQGPTPSPTPRPDAPQVVTRNVVLETRPRSPRADRLNASDATATDDVACVLSLFENYLVALKEVPTGTNREITAALSGRNSLKLAPLPNDHPAISPEGELLDRWGRPYAFHCVSRHVVEIRSRGADGILFTDDDVVRANGPIPAALSLP